MPSATDTDTDPQRIGSGLEELKDVCSRNPNKTLMQVIARATRDTTEFTPNGVSDEDLLVGLRSTGKRR